MVKSSAKLPKSYFAEKLQVLLQWSSQTQDGTPEQAKQISFFVGVRVDKTVRVTPRSWKLVTVRSDDDHMIWIILTS